MRRNRAASGDASPMEQQQVTARAAGRNELFGEEHSRSGYSFYSVTHDIFGDPFWAVYRSGLERASREQRCTVRHLSPEHYEPALMAELLWGAVDARPHGLIATVPDEQAVEAPLRAAVERGIPLIVVNMPDRRHASERIPYLLYIGPNDINGGQLAARQLLRQHGTMRELVCVDHYQIENASHAARRVGLERELGQAGVGARLVSVFGEDHQRSVSLLEQELAGSNVEAVCTLGPPGALAVLDALDHLHRQDVVHGSFDLALGQLDAIDEGRLAFTIDSQQHLQGYLGITLLQQYVAHDLLPAGEILTGPRLIDQPAVARARAGVLAGVR
jgi:simple sugar transport system substrate-binding protein